MSKTIYLRKWLSKLRKQGYFGFFDIYFDSRKKGASLTDNMEKTIAKFCYLIAKTILANKLLDEIGLFSVNINATGENNDFISRVAFSIGDSYHKDNVVIYIDLTDYYIFSNLVDVMFPRQELKWRWNYVNLSYKYLAKMIIQSFNLPKIGIDRLSFSVETTSFNNNSNYERAISKLTLQQNKHRFISLSVSIQNHLPEFFIPIKYGVKIYQKLFNDLHKQCHIINEGSFSAELYIEKHYERKNTKENFVHLFNDYIIKCNTYFFRQFENSLVYKIYQQSTNVQEFIDNFINNNTKFNNIYIYWRLINWDRDKKITFTLNSDIDIASILNFMSLLICKSYQFQDVLIKCRELVFDNNYVIREETDLITFLNLIFNKLLPSYRNLTQFCK